MKKLIALLLALAMVLSLGACGAKEAPETEAPTAPKEETPAPAETPAEPAPAEEENAPVTLSLWIYDDGDVVTDLYEEFAASVNEAYPWITIETEVLPYDSGPEKFVVACATNTTPDLYFDGYSRIAPAVKAGLTVDVTDVIQNNNVFISQQKDGIMADGKYGYVSTATGAAYCPGPMTICWRSAALPRLPIRRSSPWICTPVPNPPTLTPTPGSSPTVWI